MQVPSNIFREYDIRGVADTDLASSIVEQIGKGYGTWLSAKGIRKVVVGGDVRHSTARIREAVTRGLVSVGIDVVDIGVVTTPILYWSLFHLDLRGGVMITGSHNPKDMNGLKLAYEKATLWGQDIQDIRALIQKGEFLDGAAPGEVSSRDIGDAYTGMLLSKIKLGSEKKPLKVAYDCGNGAASLYFGKFVEGLGCEGFPLYDTPDGDFPNHHPDPQKRENLQDLIRLVREKKADVGVAFDGDADRVGVVDELGEVVWADRLMALYWQEILPKYPDAEVLIEVKCTLALEEEAKRLGGRPYYWKSGHSVIKAKMKELNAPFAGEYSGHMFFADEFYGFDDAAYAAGRLFRILSNSRESLSQLMAKFPEYPATEEIRVNCPDEEKFQTVERILQKAQKDHEVITSDGARILFPDGWGLIRASNTQPVLCTRCEARNPEALKKICDEIKGLLLSENLPDFEWTY